MPPVDAVLLILAVSLGLIFGSFLNVCVVRLPQGQSIVSPRSHCVSCSYPVRTRDNIPVVSWLLLRGRCRACGAAISLRYPLVEMATAILFALCVLRFGSGVEAIGMAVFCWLLLGLLLMDAETFLLPDGFTLPGILLGLVYGAATVPSLLRGLGQAMLGAATIAGFLWLVSLAYRIVRRQDGMGFGDVKLGAMLGAWLGWKMGAVALFLAIVAGAVGGVVTVILQPERSESLKSNAGTLRVPFGAFLAAAGILSVFAGAPLLHWYLGFFPR